MIVVDSSVVVAALVEQSRLGDSCRKILELEEPHVPHLLDIEVTSALRGLVTGRVIDQRRAGAALVDLADLRAMRYGHLPLLPSIWQLRGHVSAYDAAYVSLARLLSCRLVTGDGPLARAPGLGVPVELVR